MYTSTLLTEQNQDAQRGCVCDHMTLFCSILLLFVQHLYLFLCLLTERQSRKVLHECSSQWWWQTRFRWTCRHHYWTGRWPWCRTWLILMGMDRNRWALLWAMHELIMYTLNAVQVALHKCLCQMHAYKCECKLYILRAGIFNLLLRTSKKMIPFQSWKK